MATTIFTDYGQQLITEAIANKTTINITKIAVGDGMGAVYTPVPTQTALKRETWSGPIDSVQVNPTNKNQVTFEGIVGANVGGFYIREIGLYDQANKLVAISDFPESFKALADQYELYVRMILQTGSADVTNIIINKDMIYATKKYVDTEVAKKYVKPTTGIPELDLDSAVQAALGKARTALQSVTKADVGLGNVDNTSDGNKPISIAQQAALDKKANLASPVFTGTPTVPTASESTNSSVAASTAFVNRAVATHQADLVSHGIYGVATGTNALVMTDSKVTSYVDGMLVAFKNTTASTGATTLNINNLGAKAIVKANGTAVNNLKANAIYQLRYNGVNFILLGEGGEYGNVTAADVRSTKVFGTEDGVVQGTLNLSQLIPGNIKKGVTIDGVLGSLDVDSLGGKNYASGSVTLDTVPLRLAYKDVGSSSSSEIDFYCATVTNLNFTPNFIVIYYSDNSFSYYNTKNKKGLTLNLESMTYRAEVLTITTDMIYNGGFKLPVSRFIKSGTVNWSAYE